MKHRASRLVAKRPSKREANVKPVPVPVPVPQERRSHQTTPSSSSGSNALREPVERRPLTTEQQEQIRQVCFIWAEWHGWPRGQWPRDRRYDAVQITEWVRRLGGAPDFWRAAIALVPHDAHFTALSTIGPSGLSRLENLLITQREGGWAEQKKRYAREAVSIGDVMRKAMEQQGAA